MRPTIDDQLGGADRLLDLVAADPGLGDGSRELLVNARRLLRTVRRSWDRVVPFAEADNARMTELLGEAAPPDVGKGPLERQEELRAALAAAIPDLDDGARAEIGRYLRERVEEDPA
jgi:hypothetical protein